MSAAGVQCFLLEATEQVEVNLRRYASGCKGPSIYSFHNALFPIGRQRFGAEMSQYRVNNGPVELSDPRWPTKCAACDYQFKETDEKQYFVEHLYRRADTGEILTLAQAPVGAMWYAEQFNDWYANMRGPDGRTLIVRTPGGDWCIDARAKNCDSKCQNCGVAYNVHSHQGCGSYVDHNPSHHCWIRHGDVPNVHVDKAGNTCGAGGGSWVSPNESWHGFLHHGCLHT
jgi:hypothetical protein